MSIQTEITRLQTAKADIKTAIELKGVNVPSSATIDTYDDYVSQIVTGGGGSSSAETALAGMIDRFITEVVIPSGVTEIGNNAFYECRSLTSTTIPNTVTRIRQYAFGYCTGLTSVVIPDSVTSIGNDAFRNCSGLTSVNIPNGVTILPDRVFYSCINLTSIIIPSSVTLMGTWVFGDCIGLTSITCLATTPPTIGTNVFNNTNDCPIYVPAESLETYKEANNWSTYASRIQAIPE